MNNLNIKWLGQSGYIIGDGETEICIDPYLSDLVEKITGNRRMIAPVINPREISSDVLICTHNHLDHLDTDTIKETNLNSICFLCPSDGIETLRECGAKKCKSFDEGTTLSFGKFTLTALFADHTVPAVGVLVEHGKTKLYFSGDTYYHKKLDELKSRNIDISFICINGKLGNMDVNDAVKLTAIINPKVAVPNHYGMFQNNTEDPKKYISNVKNGFEMQVGREYSVKEVLENV